MIKTGKTHDLVIVIEPMNVFLRLRSEKQREAGMNFDIVGGFFLT